MSIGRSLPHSTVASRNEYRLALPIKKRSFTRIECSGVLLPFQLAVCLTLSPVKVSQSSLRYPSSTLSLSSVTLTCRW